MTADSPETKAFRYVTDDLGVHTVYEHALATRSELEGALNRLAGLRAERRRLEALKTDLEMAVANDLRAGNPEMSAAAFDRQLKIEINNSGDVREVRDSLSDLVSQIEALEYTEKLLEVDIRVDTARLNELGGLLQFMAVIKSVSAAKNP